MCGIAGIMRWGTVPDEREQRDEIECMTRSVRHRGPDGEGYYCNGGVALGHRRLAIIDLVGGAQPMRNEDATVWITYNGEVYNYLELRVELEAAGHQFASASDTEVIVHAYEEWGENCVQHLRGMFAFAIADFGKRQVLLARDPFGMKPLVYRLGEAYLAFGSELAALRAVKDAPPRGSLIAVDYYLRYGYIPSPHTIYEGVSKLPPGHTLSIGFDGEIGQLKRYYSLEFAPCEELSPVEWEERSAAVLRESVGAHLVSDVPFGVFLSGGVDSTLVAAEMSELLQQPVNAFAIGFDQEEYSELKYARQAAAKLGIKLHTQIVGDAALDNLPELVSHYGEPFGDSSALPTWHVARLAREHVPMVLSGDGGDELFGGYDIYGEWMNEGSHNHPLAQSAGYLLAQRPRAAARALQRWVQPGQTDSPTNYDLNAWERHSFLLSDSTRQQLWKEGEGPTTGSRNSLWENAGREAQSFDRLGFAQSCDVRTYLPHDILTKVDIASMYHGLEVRPPLVDLRVAEFAATLPLQQRMTERGWGRAPTGKVVLKKIMEHWMPPEFVYRRKQGFAIPRTEWFLPGRAGRNMLLELLNDRSLPLSTWFDRDYIDRALQLHSKRSDQSALCWALLVLGLWLRQNPEIAF